MGNLVQMPDSPEDKSESLEKEPEKMICGVLVGAEGEKKPCGQEAFSKCTACGVAKCGEHISNVDPSNCTSCSNDVEVSVKLVTKNNETYDDITDETIVRTYQAKSIHLGGEHWLNNNAMIALMPDAKLRAAIEHNKQTIKMMEEELLHRKITKSKATLAANPVHIRRRTPSTTSVTTEKRTVTRKRGPKKIQTPEELMASLAAAGVDSQKLIDMLMTKLGDKLKKSGS